MIGARIKCDGCGFIGEMEFSKVCNTTVNAPSGWATIYPTIRIKGERELSRKQKDELKQKIRDKTPPFHVCPSCIFGSYEIRLNRLLGKKEADAKT